MATAIQRRRGTTVQHDNFTGLVGEITIDTDLKTVRVHDGTTPGGFVLARADGGVEYSGNLLPSANNTYSLGSPTSVWKDIYVGGNTIFIDGFALSVTDGLLQFNGSNVAVAGGVSSDFNSDDVNEGSTNLYFTEARARASISVSGDLSYDSNTGVIGFVNDLGDIESVTAGDGLTGGGESGNVTLNVGAGDGITVDANSVAVNVSYVRGLVSVTDAGGDGSLVYDNSTGVITYTGPSQNEANARIDAHLSGGTGVTYNSGVISIGQAVDTTSEVSFSKVTTTSDVVVGGNLTVQGTQVILNTTTVETEDTIFRVNSGGATGTDVGFEANVGGNIKQILYTTANKWSVGSETFVANTFEGNVTGNVTGNLTGNVTGDVTGTVSSIANHSTTDLAEGTNLYFTAARARGNISVTDAGGDGSLAYDNSTGVITYTGPSQNEANARIDARLSGGTGVAYNSGVISIGQAVGTGDSVTFAGITGPLTGNVTGNLTGDVTGNVTGNLTGDVTGTVSSIANHSTTDLVEGTNLYFTTVRARDSITVTDAGGDGSLAYDNSTGVITYTGPSQAEANTRIDARLSGGTGITYNSGVIATTITQYTDTLARAAISVTDAGGDGSLAYNNSTGVITYTGPSAAEARAHFSAGTGITLVNGVIAAANIPNSSLANSTITINGTAVALGGTRTLTTTDVAEGTNQYFTTARARDSISVTDAGGDGSLAYNNSTGVITYTGPSASEANARIDARLSGGTGVTYTSGVISIGQDVAANANVSFNRISNLLTPSSDLDAANKQYVDEVAQGLQARTAANALSDSNLSATYDNGTDGVGATLTASANGAFPAIDGVTLDITDKRRLLVTGQTNKAHNGLYVLIDAGSASTPWVLRRCVECDESTEIPGSFVFIKEGTTYASTGWVAITPIPFTVGTSEVNWTQFSGAGTFTAGSGLSLDGSQFNVNIATSGGLEIVNNDLQLKSSVAGNGLTYASGVITVGAGSGIDVTATNVAVNASFVRGQVSVTDAGGDGSLAYNNSTGVITYTGPNQTEANARIDARLSGGTGITYTSGVIAAANIPNSSLANSTITINGTAVALGGTRTLTTTDVAEGTNLYFTTARANTAIDNRIVGGNGLTYNAGTLAVGAGAFIIANAANIAVDATSANTGSKVVARDASGNFSAGTITAALVGNASTATTLATARTLTIGSTGKTFDGSANVSWTLSEIGVNNSTLTLATSGIATGSQTFTSNQGTNATFTVNVPGTNIAEGTRTTTTVPITSSTGTNATLSAASTTLAGVMSSADKTKLDGIAAGAQVNTVTSVAGKTGAVTLTGADVGLGNLTNHAQVRKLTSSTSGNIPTWNGTTGDQLANGYGVETTLTGGTGNLARADAIKSYVDGLLAANDAMIFKGTLGTGGTYTALPTTHNVGWTIKVITAGTYAGQNAEIGDMYVSLVSRSGSGNLNSDWAVIQTNIDGAVTGPASSTDNHVALFNGTTGKAIKSSGVVLGAGTLTLATSGIATGSQTFGANQNTNATFTVNVPATNIAQGTRTTTTVPITSSTGTNATLDAATTSLAGVMSSADKTKLDGIAAGAQVNVATNIAQGTRTTTTVPITSSTGTGATLDAASTTLAGVMSSADKTKLDGIAAGAQVNVATNLGITAGTTAGPIVTSSTGTNATLPTASATASGVVTTGNQTWAGVKTFNSTITGSISGNAGTATALQTARNIGGVSFNGTGDINLPGVNTTGNQDTTGTSAGVVRTVAGTTSAELVRGNMGDNDQARILVGATASNEGFLEIATADDGTEPIHVRQYTGVFTSLVRTATLLDGSGNTSFPGIITGTATSARYADLAERYEADEVLEPGTVVCFGGEKEITACTHENDHAVAGVVSTDPAYMMNSDAGSDATHPYIALTGRVPCKVVGVVNKGDLMVAAGNGRAMANNNAKPGTIIGKAITSSAGGEAVIEVLVNMM